MTAYDQKEEVYKIGVINKPHGVRGEVSFTFSDDIFDRADCDYLVLLLGRNICPFFIEEYRFKSSNVALVKFEGVDTAEKARMFTNVEVYFPIRYAEEDGDAALSWNIFEGFKVIDKNHGFLGEIVGVDDSTINVLFVIEKEGKELLLPAHEEFILDVDRENKAVHVDVPDGLLD